MSESFIFDLPPDLIAQAPPDRRGDSRLLRVERGVGLVGEAVFRDLPGLLRTGDRLVLNDSRVLPARLLTRREDTGGQVEILLLQPARDDRWPGAWLSMARPTRRLRAGVRLVLDAPPGGGPGPQPVVTVLDKRESAGGVQVVIGADEDLAALAEAWGVMPLPPYIKRAGGSPTADEQDRRRYQTVYAREDATGAGSVAAPTAGLHFSAATLDRLAEKGVGLSRVSLHVGPGTFQPPSPEQIANRRLHREVFHLPAAVNRALAETRAAGGRVIAVGTTSLRVLESVRRLQLDAAGPDQRIFGPTPADPDPFFTGRARRIDGHWDVAGETRLFICPPDAVAAADGLLTNFHLPGSSLLMLVASLLGADVWRDVYRHAVASRLRFYSYGDCMLIMPPSSAGTAGPKRAPTESESL